MGKVFISPNLKRTSERIDPNGNVINPATKQIIIPKEEEYVPPSTPIATLEAKIEPIPQPIAKDDGLSVLQQIEQAKAHLQSLEELKRLKIEEKKKELELLQQ